MTTTSRSAHSNQTTRVVVIRGQGGVDVLDFDERPVRRTGFGEIRVEVRAVGLNRADVMQRLGRYPAPPGSPPDVPGLEYAGEVVEAGEGVSSPRVGDAVMGIVGGGSFAQQIVVNAREAIPVPAGMDLRDAAAIPEVFLTVFDALLLQAKLRSGEVALIHSVGSGIGTAALQVANAVGAIPVGTSRTKEKLERCRVLGLRHGIHVEGGTFADALRRESGGRGADVVLDTVGAAYLGENVKSLEERGRIVLLGLLGGATAELPLGAVLAKRARLIGTVLRARPLEEKAALAQSFRREMLPLFESGRLKPVVDRVLPMQRVREAHEALERNETFGKLVLEW